MFQNLSLKKKLILFVFVLSFFLIGTSGIQFFGAQRSSIAYEKAVEQNTRLNELLHQMEGQRAAMLAIAYQLLHFSHSKSDREALVTQARERSMQMQKVEEFYRTSDIGKDNGEFAAVMATWKELTNSIYKLGDFSSGIGPEAWTQVQERMRGSLEKEKRNLEASIEKLMAYHRNESAQIVRETQEGARAMNLISLFAVLASLAVYGASGVMIGQTTSAKVRTLAERLSSTSAEVLSEAVKVSEASTEMSAAMTEQSSAIEETVAAVDEISAMVKKSADNSETSSKEANRMNQMAVAGKQSLDRVVSSIGSIASGSEEMMSQIAEGNGQLGKIIALINEIGEKTKVINDIVFQTKLLSFNASVEAARAGEHGKGFAVVAEEVGNLAQMSGSAAKQISDMLEASTGEVNRIINESKHSIEELASRNKERLEEGQSLTRECATIFESIISQASEVSNTIKDIATASREQASGIGEINRVMAALSQTNSQNAVTTSATANTAVVLQKQAEEVKLAVSELMEFVQGKLRAQQWPSLNAARRSLARKKFEDHADVEAVKADTHTLFEAASKLTVAKGKTSPSQRKVLPFPAKKEASPGGESRPANDVGGFPEASDSRFEKV